MIEDFDYNNPTILTAKLQTYLSELSTNLDIPGLLMLTAQYLERAHANDNHYVKEMWAKNQRRLDYYYDCPPYKKRQTLDVIESWVTLRHGDIWYTSWRKNCCKRQQARWTTNCHCLECKKKQRL